MALDTTEGTFDMKQTLSRGLEKLHPAYFAMVMATGIVAIAAYQQGYRWVAVGLTWLNVGAYVVLWALFLLRLAKFRESFLADLVDHSRGVGFFTMIAGTCVLGSQLVVVYGRFHVPIALWILGMVLWAAIIYTVFTAFTVKEEKPPLEVGINGGWLVGVVGTQAVAILGELLVGKLHPRYEWVHYLSLSLWLWGGMLYIWLISLIFYRYTFFRFRPSDLMPPYWINMGAMAISTLAGATILGNAAQTPMLTSLAPFIEGFTIFFWATATWWIPMLVILGFWRHVVKRFKLTYEPLYWGAVFPLGMYTACTYKLAMAAKLPFLLHIPKYFVFVALAAWALTFFGLLARWVSLAKECAAEPGEPALD